MSRSRSIVGLIMMVGGMVGLILRQQVLSPAPVVIVLQVCGVALVVWARRTFGRHPQKSSLNVHHQLAHSWPVVQRIRLGPRWQMQPQSGKQEDLILARMIGNCLAGVGDKGARRLRTSRKYPREAAAASANRPCASERATTGMSSFGAKRNHGIDA